MNYELKLMTDIAINKMRDDVDVMKLNMEVHIEFCSEQQAFDLIGKF